MSTKHKWQLDSKVVTKGPHSTQATKTSWSCLWFQTSVYASPPWDEKVAKTNEIHMWVHSKAANQRDRDHKTIRSAASYHMCDKHFENEFTHQNPKSAWKLFKSIHGFSEALHHHQSHIQTIRNIAKASKTNCPSNVCQNHPNMTKKIWIADLRTFLVRTKRDRNNQANVVDGIRPHLNIHMWNMGHPRNKVCNQECIPFHTCFFMFFFVW